MSVDSIDTRSLRKEAYTMLRTGEAIDKTLKWTMRTKLKTGPIAKISLTVDPPRSPENVAFTSESAPGSPISGGRRSPLHTPSLERATTFTQSGVSKPEQSLGQLETPGSLVTLKGKAVPVDLLKDAIVDVVRKEGSILRDSPTKKKGANQTLEMTDEASFDSRGRYFDSMSTISNNLPPQFMWSTQAKKVAKLADPREEANQKWKHMKQIRDERNASLERRKQRAELMQSFTRVVLHTEQAEFNRAYRDQYMHREYTVQRQHERRVEERRKLDENLNRRITSKRKQQQQEGKFMRKLLRDSVNKSRAALWEEVSMTKMNNELNGTVSRSQSCLDVSSSSQIQIPDQLKNKVKQAKSQAEFDKAQKEIKDFYQASISERIGEYTRNRSQAITRASMTDTRLTLSPIRGSDLFQDSVGSREFEEYELQQFLQAHLSAQSSKHRSFLTPKTPGETALLKPMTPSPPRPSTSDFVLKEYFASRTVQQELFDLENFSLHSSEDVSAAMHELSLEK